MTLVWSLLGLAAAAGALIAAVVYLGRRQLRAEEQKRERSEAAVLAAQQRELDRAAQAELAAGRLESARELFLRARRPGKAAQVAVKEGKLELAGMLFEREGRLDKALVAYRKAGKHAKVQELEAKLAGPAPQASEAPPGSGRPRPKEPSLAPVPSYQPSDPAPWNVPDRAETAPWNRMSDEAQDAWLLEDGLLELPCNGGLLELPGAEPARPPALTPPAGTAVGRAALGVISLIKSRKSRAIVEETVAQRRDDDDR